MRQLRGTPRPNSREFLCNLLMMEIHSTVPGVRIARQFVLACADAGSVHLRLPIGQINFVLVNDRRMSSLHRNYSGIPGTTDVLTFDLTDGDKQVDGDIYICLDQARRQARKYGVPLRDEVARLAVHGVLHLAGFDDHDEIGRKKMRMLEDRALEHGKRRQK